MNVTEIKTVFDLTLRVGALLIANGATSQITEATMQQMTEVYGLPPCHPNVYPTFFSLSLEHPDLEYPLTRVQRVRGRTTNYGRLVQVFALVERLQRDHVRPQAALAAVEELERKPLPDPLWIRLLSWAGACAASTLLLGGNGIEIGICFLIVLPAQFCRQWIARQAVPAFFGDLFAAVIVTALALGISKSPLALRTNLVIAGSLFSLLPGAAIVTSAQELIEGDLLSSAARGLEALLLGAAIAAGVGFTLTVAAHLALGTQVSHAGTAGWTWPLQLLAAGVASLCYGRASTVPRFALLYAGVIGVGGWLIYLLIPQNTGQDLLLATFLATLVAGCMSRIIAALQQVPVVLYTLPGVFPFLPGYTVYQGMFAIVQGKGIDGVVLLVQAVAIAGTIALGIALSSLLTPALRRLQRAERGQGKA
jgi:uncharacterized membrane protein YjjP (DUF1212 family)